MKRITDTNRSFTVEKDLITKYEIKQSILCDLIGISQGDFHNKWHEKRGSRFTDAQKDKITHYLVCMGKVILGELEKIDLEL